MRKYSKSIAAAIGLVAIVTKEFFNLKIGDDVVNQIVTLVLAIITGSAVYGVKNNG